jgi:hypothetical protein
MMTVGNHHWVRSNRSRNCRDASVIGYAFDAVDDPEIIGKFAKQLGWLCKQG